MKEYKAFFMKSGATTLCPSEYRISSVIRQFSFRSKTIQKIDGSGSLQLFRKGKTHIVAKFHRTDLRTCSHSREKKKTHLIAKKIRYLANISPKHFINLSEILNRFSFNVYQSSRSEGYQ